MSQRVRSRRAAVPLRAKRRRPAPLEVVGVDDQGRVLTRGFLDRVRTLLPSLNPADRRVAEYLVGDPEQVVLASVSEVALAAGSSTATVVRLCQKLGLRGFQHLKIAVAQDLAPRDELHVSELTPTSTPAEVLATVVRSASEGFAAISATLDIADLSRAVEAIGAARRIAVCGVGSSTWVAQDFGLRLMTIGLLAEAHADSHQQYLQARLLREGDVLVAVSNSGATRETVENVRAAAGQGAVTIAVTGYRRSPLADAVDIALVAGSPQLLAMRTESMASRLVHLAILDAIVVALALSRGSAAAAALDAVDEVASRHRY